ncbi:hypothetical protein FRC07_011580 [Ceratobasidium sp. 392]|nr:hypothetical protein FRC07_011580 [Ceratobasidium sp. 392]
MSIEDTDSYAHSLARELVRLQSLRSSRLGLYLIPSTTILAHKLYHRRNVVAPELIEWQHAITSAALLDGGILGHDATLPNPPPVTTDQPSSILYEADPVEEFGSEHMCELCVESVSQIGYDAETGANAILRELPPNLTNAEWMAWLSPGHIGVNTYEL